MYMPCICPMLAPPHNSLDAGHARLGILAWDPCAGKTVMETGRVQLLCASELPDQRTTIECLLHHM